MLTGSSESRTDLYPAGELKSQHSGTSCNAEKVFSGSVLTEETGEGVPRLNMCMGVIYGKVAVN